MCNACSGLPPLPGQGECCPVVVLFEVLEDGSLERLDATEPKL